MTGPTLADVEAARARLAGVARETPLYSSETFSRLAGRPVLLKAENLQRTGSFKIRGAYNTIATLTPREQEAGVVAASAGNHGQAVAWAAREAGISARFRRLVERAHCEAAQRPRQSRDVREGLRADAPGLLRRSLRSLLAMSKGGTAYIE